MNKRSKKTNWRKTDGRTDGRMGGRMNEQPNSSRWIEKETKDRTELEMNEQFTFAF